MVKAHGGSELAPMKTRLKYEMTSFWLPISGLCRAWPYEEGPMARRAEHFARRHLAKSRAHRQQQRGKLRPHHVGAAGEKSSRCGQVSSGMCRGCCVRATGERARRDERHRLPAPRWAVKNKCAPVWPVGAAGRMPKSRASTTKLYHHARRCVMRCSEASSSFMVARKPREAFEQGASRMAVTRAIFMAKMAWPVISAVRMARIGSRRARPRRASYARPNACRRAAAALVAAPRQLRRPVVGVNDAMACRGDSLTTASSRSRRSSRCASLGRRHGGPP